MEVSAGIGTVKISVGFLNILEREGLHDPTIPLLNSHVTKEFFILPQRYWHVDVYRYSVHISN